MCHNGRQNCHLRQPVVGNPTIIYDNDLKYGKLNLPHPDANTAISE